MDAEVAMAGDLLALNDVVSNYPEAGRLVFAALGLTASANKLAASMRDFNAAWRALEFKLMDQDEGTALYGLWDS